MSIVYSSKSDLKIQSKQSKIDQKAKFAYGFIICKTCPKLQINWYVHTQGHRKVWKSGGASNDVGA